MTSRLPNDELYKDLVANADAAKAAGIKSIKAIGDAYAPAAIAHAVYSGHRYARELDEIIPDGMPFKREMSALAHE